MGVIVFEYRTFASLAYFSDTLNPLTKSEGYSFGVVRRFCRSKLCLSGTISQYLLVRFDSFLVQMISTMDS